MKNKSIFASNDFMIWHILRYWIAFFIPAFYKRLQVKNIQNVLVKGPVIIAMNHPNAFTDPILFTSMTHPLKLKYLARGDAFKPGLISWILESIGIVPIFRIQDGGKEGLKKNEDAYRRVNYLLSKNSKLIVFAEGLCIQERRLRPLKKGVSRMVFGAYESLKHDELVVVPVGVNYSKANKFRSTAFYNVGEPIKIKDLYPDYLKHPAKTNNTFLQLLEPRMKELITHINDPVNDELVEQVEVLYKKNRIIELGLHPTNLEHDFIVLTELTEKINRAALNQSELLATFKRNTKDYFESLKKLGIRDWLIDPKSAKSITYFSLFWRLLAILAGFPPFLTGFIANYLPFKLSDVITRKITRHREFYSSFALGIAMVLFLITYTLWYVVLTQILPPNFWPPFFLLIFGLCAWFSLYYCPFFMKSLGIWRILMNKKTYNSLAQQRAELITAINKF